MEINTSVLARYVNQFKDKPIIIKFGGDLVKDQDSLDNLCEDIHVINTLGISVVLVHGYGPQLDELQKRMRLETKKIEGLRYTDKPTIQLIYGASGEASHDIVSTLWRHGSQAVGMAGANSGIIFTRRYFHPGENGRQIDLGYVGEPVSISAEVIQAELDKEKIPVISSQGMDQETYEVHNVNADKTASYVACALGAEKIIYMTNTGGILRNIGDPESVISVATPQEVTALIEDGTVQGGMIPKVNGCIHTIKGGVKRAHIVNGYVPKALQRELFTAKGEGTMILAAEEMEKYKQELANSNL
jgi:acetylglutamate kinase